MSTHSSSRRVEAQALLQRARDLGEPVFYLGVGSNMSLQKLTGRANIKIISWEPAFVNDYRVAFNLSAFISPLEPCMAGIEPSPGDICYGGLAQLTADDYEKVWNSEGGTSKNPPYEEVVVKAYKVGSTSSVSAIALRGAPMFRTRHDLTPSRRYMSLLIEGATELNLPMQYIEKLKSIEVARPSFALQLLTFYHTYTMSAILRVRMTNMWYIRYFTRILAFCYCPPSRGILRYLLSEISICMLILPSSILGVGFAGLFKIMGLPIFPPFLALWQKC